MEKNKIFIISWYGVSEAGGVERVTQYMMEAWEEYYEVEIIDFSVVEKNKRYGRWLHKHYALDAIVVSQYARQVQKKYPAAKFIIQGFNAPLLNADIAFAHGTMRGYRLALEGGKAKWHLNQLYEKWGESKAKKVIAVGMHVKRELISLYGIEEKKIQVIENCVDTEAFYPMERKDDTVCRIIFAGRIEYGKGIETLRRLAEEIENTEDIKLLIATNKSENTELFNNLSNTEIQMGLNKEQMNSFYNRGNVMFFPSLYEGFGMVTTECLSAGVPVIGNDLGAVGDLYSYGQEGVELLSDDMNQNLRRVRELAEQYRNTEMRQKLHEDMKQKYDLKIYKKRLREIWGRI